MVKQKKYSRRRSPAPTPAIPPVSPTEPMNVQQYDVVERCTVPRGAVMVFNNAGHPCPPYLQQGQRMFPGMLIESAPEYVDELIRKRKIIPHVDPKPDPAVALNGT